MSVKIGHSSIDENGKAHSGNAGDSTKKEVCMRTWYKTDWHTVLRPIDDAVAEKMAVACEAGCLNDKIGYDQWQRNTLRTQAKAVGYDLSKITVPCECDCSSFMAVCAECAGIDIPYYTGNAPTTSSMVSAFNSTGEFKVLQESKYLTTDAYLKRGDILVKSGHTVMVLGDGEEVSEAEIGNMMYKKEYNKNYTTTAELNLRLGAGTDMEKVAVMKKNASVQGLGYYTIKNGARWAMVQYGKYIGFCSMNYLK